MSSLSQNRCFVVFLTLTENLFTLNRSASIFDVNFDSGQSLIYIVVGTIRFSRNNSHEEENNCFLKIPKIENCFDRFRKQFVIFFSSFLEHFEGQSEIWNFYFEFWRKLNIFIIFDICFIIGRLSWDQRK